jgi:hypothetical protein
MKLVIDIDNNRICVDDASAKAGGRWEALALATLFRLSTDRETSLISRPVLQEVLTARGQVGALNRTQWRRLWSSVERMFATLNRADVFSLRFDHAPRSRTVGPWGWRHQEGDEVTIVDTKEPARSLHSLAQWHRLAFDGDLRTSLDLCRKLALCHSHWANGARASACEEFSTGEEWKLASPELLTHRALYLSDGLIMAGEFSDAVKWLTLAERLIAEHPTCRDQATYAGMIRYAVAPFRSGVESSPLVWANLKSQLAYATISGHEIDYKSRAWIMHWMARSKIAEIESITMQSSGLAVAAREVIDVHIGGIVFSILGGNYDVVVYGLESLFSNLVLCSSSASRDDVKLLLQCYECAQLWMKYLEPTEGFHFGEIWLAVLWLKHPWISSIFDAASSTHGWLGGRPDTIQFYRSMLTKHEAGSDPAWAARAAVVTYRFAKLRSLEQEKLQALGLLRRIYIKYPQVASRLQSSGFFDQTNELLPEFGFKINGNRRTTDFDL